MLPCSAVSAWNALISSIPPKDEFFYKSAQKPIDSGKIVWYCIYTIYTVYTDSKERWFFESILKSLPVRMSGLFCLQKKRKGNGRNWPFLVLNLYGVFWCMCHPDVLSGSGIMGFYVPAANTKSSLYAGISSDAKNIFQSSGIRRCQKYWNSYTG